MAGLLVRLFFAVTSTVTACAEQAAASECQKKQPEYSSRLVEIRLMERLIAKLTDDMHQLDNVQERKNNAFKQSPPTKLSLLRQKIQSLERKKTILLADKDTNFPPRRNIALQKSSALDKNLPAALPTGSISGKVSTTGGDVDHVYVLAFDIVTMEDAYTDSSGDYTIDHLPDSNDYYLFVDGTTATGMSCNSGYYDSTKKPDT
ncbi:MAG: hypothetical protein D3923_17915, partial [Candidatus Electrothrix sp. AR3]|nr:hypothetical protein [Candidatus Electrothrix sp. AR3]